eukprot:50293-Eustigmatos_ZCMA.PRE.1
MIGRVYKMVCRVTGLVYVGSTTQTLEQRLAEHLKHYKRWQNGTYVYVTSYKVIENGKYDIVLLEEVEYETNDQLLRRERHHIENTPGGCVNRVIPTRTHAEYYQQHAELIRARAREYHRENRDAILGKHKRYYEANADHIKAYQKEYNAQNGDKVKERQAAYYEANAEKIKAYQKQYNAENGDMVKARRKKYREANADNIKAKKAITVLCECGTESRRDDMARHCKSKKHQAWLAQQTSDETNNI